MVLVEVVEVGHGYKGEGERTADVTGGEDVDFGSLLLSPAVLTGLARSGFARPSPVQLEAIPVGKLGLGCVQPCCGQDRRQEACPCRPYRPGEVGDWEDVRVRGAGAGGGVAGEPEPAGPRPRPHPRDRPADLPVLPHRRQVPRQRWAQSRVGAPSPSHLPTLVQLDAPVGSSSEAR